jgi:hypothetical protein
MKSPLFSRRQLRADLKNRRARTRRLHLYLATAPDETFTAITINDRYSARHAIGGHYATKPASLSASALDAGSSRPVAAVQSAR